MPGDLTSEPPDPPASVIRRAHSERQRRAARRLSFNAHVELLSPRPGEGVTINASEGGLRIAVDCMLRPDEICLIRVDDPTTALANGAGTRIERARVAWSRQLPDGCIAGLELLRLH
jgi:hypothetical protein